MNEKAVNDPLEERLRNMTGKEVSPDFANKVLLRVREESELIKTPKDYLPLISRVLVVSFSILLIAFLLFFGYNYRSFLLSVSGEQLQMFQFVLLVLISGLLFTSWGFLAKKSPVNS